MLQITEDLIRSVVQEVLTSMNGAPKKIATSGKWGVFDNVDEAVTAAKGAQERFEALGLDARRKAVACIRKICTERAEELGKDEFEETKIGRLDHKIEKLKVVAERIPGVEFLRTDAFSGELGVSLQEFAPFGI